MKEYDNYFFVLQHLERNDKECFVWKNVNSSSLAEIMEEAEKQGFVCRLRCYNEVVDIVNVGKVKMHRRDMWFIRKEDTSPVKGVNLC